MEGCQICQLLWCGLLFQCVIMNVWASGESSEAMTSHTPGAPPKTTSEHQNVESISVNSTPTVFSPLDNTNLRNTRNLIDPVPSDITDSGSCFRWAEWQTIVLVGGAVLVFALLVSTVTLAHRVRRLQRQFHEGRPTRTNVDLVSGMGYPSSSRVGSKMGSREMVSSGQAEAGLKMEEVAHTQEGKEVGGEEEAAEIGSQQCTAHQEGDFGNGEASRESSTRTDTDKEEIEVLVVV